MLNENFWTKFKRTHPRGSSKYQELYDKIAIVVYPENGAMITQEALAKIGNPKYVTAVYTDNLFGFIPSDKHENSYCVSNTPKGKMPRIACKQFLEMIHVITPGFKKIYIGNIFNGAITFDMSKQPYRIEEYIAIKGSGNHNKKQNNK